MLLQLSNTIQGEKERVLLSSLLPSQEWLNARFAAEILPRTGYRFTQISARKPRKKERKGNLLMLPRYIKEQCSSIYFIAGAFTW